MPSLAVHNPVVVSPGQHHFLVLPLVHRIVHIVHLFFDVQLVFGAFQILEAG